MRPWSERRIIQVYTDVLQLAIDLEGGDIVELALPKHLAKLDDPDARFVLLEQNDTRTYIAQSGLIGPRESMRTAVPNSPLRTTI